MRVRVQALFCLFLFSWFSSDEFADVKAVKLLRRGRRLQQVECVCLINLYSHFFHIVIRAIYGKVTDDEPTSTPSNTGSSAPMTSRPSEPASSLIPPLKPEFFSSRFWRRFCMQRLYLPPPHFPRVLTDCFAGPILTDFSSRYFAHLKGAPFLPSEGRLLGMVLVAWAVSFGVDERGAEIDQGDFAPSAPSQSPATDADTIGASVKSRRQGERPLAPAPSPLPRNPHQRSRTLRERTSQMVREIFAHVDSLGILRHPTWDGVRVLLLILGIAEGMHSHIPTSISLLIFST
jgi:hypothetical protein